MRMQSLLICTLACFQLAASEMTFNATELGCPLETAWKDSFESGLSCPDGSLTSNELLDKLPTPAEFCIPEFEVQASFQSYRGCGELKCAEGTERGCVFALDSISRNLTIGKQLNQALDFGAVEVDFEATSFPNADCQLTVGDTRVQTTTLFDRVDYGNVGFHIITPLVVEVAVKLNGVQGLLCSETDIDELISALSEAIELELKEELFVGAESLNCSFICPFGN